MDAAFDISSNAANDIGRYILEINSLSDFQKKELLGNPFQPPKNFQFPYSKHNKNNKIVKRYLNQHHLDQYPWAVFSPSEKGVFCKYCSLFASRFVGEAKCSQEVGTLVKHACTKFAKLTGKDGVLEKHHNAKYHREAVAAAQEFRSNFGRPEKEVVNLLSTERAKQIEENRKKLIPVIDTIITLGRQNIALRGHRDDGNLLTTSEEGNEGNFREILKMRIRAGDTVLKDHLTTAGANATYISKTIQNDLIQCCGDEILDTIQKRVEKGKFYSVMFDETTDLSTTSQMSVILRYVHDDDVREDFVGFFDLHGMNFPHESGTETEPKVDGKVLGQSVVSVLQKSNIDVESCVGICTDTCSVMTSEVCGAVTEIQKVAHNAVRIPCFNHSLNLSLSKCMEVQSVRNCFGVMREVIAFFHMSAKRTHVMNQIVNAKLQSLCDTRWVERQDTSIFFDQNIGSIIDTLQIIANWKDTTTSTKASLLVQSLLTSQFLISLKCISHFFTLTLPLSNLFLKKTIDLKTAKDLVTDIRSALNTDRENAARVFSAIYEKAEETASTLDVELAKPRIAGKQRNRSNYSCDTPEEFYRVSIFLPMLDQILSDLKSRFDKNTLDALALNIMLPDYLLQLDDEQLNVSVTKLWSKYSVLLERCKPYNTEDCVRSELKLWKAYCDRELKRSGELSVVEMFKMCDADIYPNYKLLLHIFLSLPISVASAERSFSALRRLKSCSGAT